MEERRVGFLYIWGIWGAAVPAVFPFLRGLLVELLVEMWHNLSQFGLFRLGLPQLCR